MPQATAIPVPAEPPLPGGPTLVEPDEAIGRPIDMSALERSAPLEPRRIATPSVSDDLLEPAPIRPVAPEDDSQGPLWSPSPVLPVAPQPESDAVDSTIETEATGPEWHAPEQLLEQLDALAGEESTAAWAMAVRDQIEQLGPAMAEQSGATPILRRLAELAGHVEALSRTVDRGSLVQELRQAGNGLRRRLVVWQSLAQLGYGRPLSARPDPADLSRALAAVDAMTSDSEAGRAWQEYLLLDALRELASQQRAVNAPAAPTDAAERVLTRLAEDQMTAQQREYASAEPIAELRDELRRWVAEPIDSVQLLADLERYERNGLASDAHRLAQARLDLLAAGTGAHRLLAEQLDSHYRNANLRVAVTEELLNRMMPQRDPFELPVRDTVLGVPVRGQAKNSTETSIELIPDAERVRMAIAVHGRVNSSTSSTQGPATFFNNSHARYLGRKQLEINMQGIRLWPAEVNASNNTKLRSLRTDYDGIPLLGMFVQNVAKSQLEQKRAAANREAAQKVAAQARTTIDDEIRANLGEFAKNAQQRVFVPLNAMQLEPVMVDAKTTKQRFTMHVRLAGNDQLGSETPRPWAPADSLASYQVHQSLINNVVQRLELDGQTFTLADLGQHIAERFNLEQSWETDPENDDVLLVFAPEDAISVQFDEGRIGLAISIAGLRKGSRQWRNFQSVVYYRPQVAGQTIEMVRDGVVQLKGRRLGIASQIALRGVFASLFPKDRPISVTPKFMEQNPEMADVIFTQFDIDAGWIAVALGPARAEVRPMITRR